MHPAYSVIFFTVSSGLGYGLLIWIGVFGAAGMLPPEKTFGLVVIGFALATVTAGLLSSTFHLGHPERAWRAFSQWRSSWLSREGVASVITYGPALALSAVWFWPEKYGQFMAPAGLASALLALITVYCTAMIYRSLKTIHAWANAHTVVGYFVIGLATGLVWLNAILALFDRLSETLALAAMAGLVMAAAVKIVYWRHIDRTPHPATPGTATGLGTIGQVRLFEGPHTEANYLMKEMGYQVARKHALKLRNIALGGGFAAAIGAIALGTMMASAGAAVMGLIAACLATFGALVERWLFFAEAKHVVTLYYGADKA
ncbi:MAG: DmsC/YnfH family molybdoenzyme membrane anchor subunit [Rhodospirillaceae bacterium]